MSVEKLRNKFRELVGQGLYVEAERSLDAWQRHARHAFEPGLHRVQLQLLRGHYRAARALAESLPSGPLCPVELVTELVSCLRVFVLHDGLANWAQGYPLRAQLAASALANIAADLAATRSYALALEWADIALEKRPDLAVCAFNRALILSYLGRFDEARAALDVLNQREPTPMAIWWLSRMPDASMSTQDMDNIRALRTDSNLSARDQAYLSYALFQSMDNRGDTELAWQVLQQGAAAARRASPHNKAAVDQVINALIKTFPLVTPVQVIHSAHEHIPIFVVGMHRSGTSLLERFLGASDQVLDLGETERLSAALCSGADWKGDAVPDSTLIQRAAGMDYAEVRRVYFDAAKDQVGAHAFVTEKTPTNFLNVGFIRQAFPEARIIHMRREATDLCFANYRELFGARITHTNSVADLLHYHQGYTRLMAHWHRCYPDAILDVDYEALVADPVATSQAVFKFCGLTWTPEVVNATSRNDRPVSTLSAMQVRQPVHTRSVARWRRYAEYWNEVDQHFNPGCPRDASSGEHPDATTAY